MQKVLERITRRRTGSLGSENRFWVYNCFIPSYCHIKNRMSNVHIYERSVFRHDLRTYSLTMNRSYFHCSLYILKLRRSIVAPVRNENDSLFKRIFNGILLLCSCWSTYIVFILLDKYKLPVHASVLAYILNL